MSASGEVLSRWEFSVLWVRHRTLAPDSPGSVRSHTQRVCKLFPSTGRKHRTHQVASGLKLREVVKLLGASDGATGRWEVASGDLSEAVQLAVEVAPDAQCRASGATSTTSGDPVFSGKRLADLWTSWGVFILLHLVHERSLAHFNIRETCCGARE